MGEQPYIANKEPNHKSIITFRIGFTPKNNISIQSIRRIGSIFVADLIDVRLFSCACIEPVGGVEYEGGYIRHAFIGMNDAGRYENHTRGRCADDS
jgi:hypothetical protein